MTASGDIDLVSFAQGSHSHTLERHVPDGHAPRMPYLPQLRRLRPAVNGAAVAALGRITDPAEAEGILARGDADLVALGRALIADPAWLRKAAAGRSHAIRYCVSCNTCWERTTALRLPLGCDNNPRVAEADECDWMPARAPAPRRVWWSVRASPGSRPPGRPPRAVMPSRCSRPVRNPGARRGCAPNCRAASR